MDVWVVYNPSPNSVGCPHPRPSQNEGRVDLQLDGFDFVAWLPEEYDLWQLSSGFKDLVDSGHILVSEATAATMPKRKKSIPSNLKPENDYDHAVAYQVALAPDKTDDMQLAKVNIFRSSEEGKEWVPEANTVYLKTRHLPLLEAAEWYLTEFVDDRSNSQNKRLRDVRRQIKAIKALL